MKKRAFFVLLILLVIGLTACVSTATQQDLWTGANSSRLTADAALQLAHFQEQALTATAEAPIIRITETAAGLAVQQSLWTSTAQSIQNTQQAGMTQTAVSWTSTAAVAQLNAQSTQIANNVIRDNLQLEREQYTNNFWAILPGISYALVAGFFILLVIVAIRHLQYRPAAVDPRGNVLPMLNVVDGSFTDIDRSPNYRGPLKENLLEEYIRRKLNLPHQLPAVTAARQDATTERDQMIDMATRGLLPETSSEARARKHLAGQEAMKQLTGPTLQSRFKVFDNEPGGLEVLDGQIVQVLDADWKENEQT